MMEETGILLLRVFIACFGQTALVHGFRLAEDVFMKLLINGEIILIGEYF